MEKKAYEPPVLTLIGTLSEITLRKSGNSHDAGGSNRRPSNAYSGWI